VAIGVSEAGEVSKDGLFSYEEVECLGACEYAPVCRLDHRYEVDLTRAKIDSLVNDRRLPRPHIKKVTAAPPGAAAPAPAKKRAPRTKKSG
jgi:NADH-quinone oxidoreductase subunit E